MTSKEALKELCSRCYVESDLCSCHPRYNGGKVNNTCSLRDAILQDLERLEKLEKFVDIYKHTNQRFIMLVQAPYSDLPNPTMEQELLRVEVLENDK